MFTFMVLERSIAYNVQIMFLTLIDSITVLLAVIAFYVTGEAIANRLRPFGVKNFLYNDIAPREELAAKISADFGKSF